MKYAAFSVNSVVSFHRDTVLLKRESKVFSTEKKNTLDNREEPDSQ